MREHKTVFDLVANIADSEGEQLTGFLLQLADTVDSHVRFEERVLFPHLERLIPEEQLKVISDQLDHEPEKDTYQDAFWKKM